MLRAVAKGLVQAGFAHVPGGARCYRRLTREVMGTQATHVDKLARVVPGYCAAWSELCGVELAGLDVWIHEAGCTPFWALAVFLLTGRGPLLTNYDATMLDRHLARAVNGVLSMDLPAGVGAPERQRRLDVMRWLKRSGEVVDQLGGQLHEGISADDLPLASCSVDLVHSGGALEHLRPTELRAFLAESLRVMRPGGIASHVFDHRDHLHHADASLPFLAHMALPDPAYRLLRGHGLGYHSRLLPFEVARLFEEAGFERIAVRRMVLPDKCYVADDKALKAQPGLPRRLLAGRFRDISEADLRTAAAHYLYRKPGPGKERPVVAEPGHITA